MPTWKGGISHAGLISGALLVGAIALAAEFGLLTQLGIAEHADATAPSALQVSGSCDSVTGPYLSIVTPANGATVDARRDRVVVDVVGCNLADQRTNPLQFTATCGEHAALENRR